MANATALPEDVQYLLTGLTSVQIVTRTDYAALAFMVYDYALTMPTELTQIWSRRLTTISYLFILLRLTALLGVTLRCFSDILPISTNLGCSLVTLIGVGLLDFSHVLTYVILIIRTYAICGRNKYVLLILAFFAVSVCAVDAWRLASSVSRTVQGPARRFTTCIESPRLSIRNYTVVTTAMSSGDIAFNTVVFILTYLKTAKPLRRRGRLPSPQGLSFRILRDGFMYYVFIELWVVAQLISSTMLTHYWTWTLLQELSVGVSAVLVLRLILDLRENNRDSSVVISSTAPGGTTAADTLHVNTFGSARGTYSEHEALELGRTPRSEQRDGRGSVLNISFQQ